MRKRRVIDRGLLNYPLRKVVKTYHTTGGNPLTNPPVSIHTLECGHKVYLTGYHERKSCRCNECPLPETKTEKMETGLYKVTKNNGNVYYIENVTYDVGSRQFINNALPLVEGWVDNPTEDDRGLILADWLEDEGMVEQAQQIRTSIDVKNRNRLL